MDRNKIHWLTRTAVLIALLVALQWATSGLGQFVTGSCVNCVLVIAALFAGLWGGVMVALVSPVCAFLLGIGPKLVQIVPAIAVGNLVLVLIVYVILGKKESRKLWLSVMTVAFSAVAKFAVLYCAVVKVMIPLMGSNLAEKQVQTFTAMFSWPQLVTALIGTAAALLLAPLLKKAMKQ